jgi:hypothetical protein
MAYTFQEYKKKTFGEFEATATARADYDSLDVPYGDYQIAYHKFIKVRSYNAVNKI